MNATYDFSNMVVTSGDLGKARNQNNFYKAVHLAGLVDNEIKDLAEIRFYGTGKTNTAILWIHSPILGLYGSEFGKAGGYGYNREDAAFQEATRKMGIKGNGYHTPRDFFEALAKYLEVAVYSVIESHA
ncbi:putative acetyltransferase [Pectobacterium phage PcCB7V]|nr:putative acetyltransferase [Pectobacterium phage PcCB7V]